MAACTVYTDENFSGDSMDVSDNIWDLQNHHRGLAGNWNDEISSIRVHDGTFRFFEHVNFKGAWRDLSKGEYSNSAAIGLLDNTISSIEKR
jgi:hypothetical protein